MPTETPAAAIVAAVLDVDGTLCFDGRTIAPPVVEALTTLRRRVPLVFASARPIRDLLPVLPPTLHDATLIGGNGAFTRESGRLTVLGLSPTERAVIDGIVDECGLAYLIDGDWDYSFTGDETHRIRRQLDVDRVARNVPRDQIRTYSKAVLFTDDDRIVRRLRAAGLSVHVHPDEGIVDVSPSGVTKLHAIRTLGIADGAYAAFGNDANDELMLRRAAVSFCVGRHPDLAFADHHLGADEVAATIATLAT